MTIFPLHPVGKYQSPNAQKPAFKIFQGGKSVTMKYGGCGALALLPAQKRRDLPPATANSSLACLKAVMRKRSGMPLIDSDQWKAAFVPLKQLRFHPMNPRLPGMRSGATEEEIIYALCARGKVTTLARSIADKGYLRQERLIVLREGSRKVVYEGNRRLCALRLLADPSAAPGSLRGTFKRLAQKAKLPQKIAIDIVPTKFEAEVVMYAKHAGDSFTLNWKPLQQAMFVAVSLEEGESIDDVGRTHNLSREEVVQFRAAIDFYRMCRLASLSDAAREMVDDPEKFPYSTLFDRLVKPLVTRQALGLEITEDGLKAPPDDEILPVLARMLEDAALDEDALTTRRLNNAEEQIAYVRSLNFAPTAPATSTAAEMEEKHQIQSPLPPSRPQPSKPKPRPRPAQPSPHLLPRSVVCELDIEKLIAVVDEAQRLNVTNLPNVAAVFLRCVLDMALHAAVNERGQRGPLGKLHQTSPDELGIGILLKDVKSGGFRYWGR